ncbi:MAG: ROK family protein, partial [Clostridia bacterium]|nr:ROK family protein [Clostridia bacterium]
EKAVNENDPAAVEVFEECVTSWARGIVSMVYAFDPEVVVLSGGVTNMGEKLLSPLRRKVLENVWTPWGKLRFITAEEPEKSVVRGLYALAEDEIKAKNKQ